MAVPTEAAAPPKTHYTVAETAQLWIEEGGPKKFALPMAIVSQYESGGDPGVVNGIGATGLYQHYPGNAGLKDPRANTRLAIQKFNSRGFQPWVSSKGGWGGKFNEKSGDLTDSGLSFLADHGVKSGKGLLDGLNALNPFDKDRGLSITPSIKNPIEGLIAPVEDIANFFVQLTDFLVHPRRLLKIVLGSVLLLWGVNQLSKNFGGPDAIGTAKRGAGVYLGAGAVKSAVASKTTAATGGKAAAKISGG